MPVKIREMRIVAGKKYEVKVYRMGNPSVILTREAKAQADRLDEFLELKMDEIRREMRETGCLKLRGRPGVLRLWYEVGSRLRFVDESSLLPAEDRKWIWRAIYDHAGELAPHAPERAASPRQMDIHFKHCYFIGTHSWDFVQRAGTWGMWWEFFYSPVIRDDDRILEWIAVVQERTKRLDRNWLRRLTQAIRREFRDIDTSYRSRDELWSDLDRVYEAIFRNQQNPSCTSP